MPGIVIEAKVVLTGRKMLKVNRSYSVVQQRL